MNSRRLQKAFAYASDLHATQTRKGKDVPYISHLMGVTAIVLEQGGTENQAIGALLHDDVEDQDVPLEEIRERFNDEVAQIVEECTNAKAESKSEWRGRREKYIFCPSVAGEHVTSNLIHVREMRITKTSLSVLPAKS